MVSKLAAVCLAAVFVATACSGEETSDQAAQQSTNEATSATEYEGVDGVVSSIEDTSRIVALNGDLTETIYALGAGDRVVGIDLTTTYPPEAAALPDVGLGRDLNAEAVIGLAPTLVIGDEQIEPQSAIDQIRAAGIPVVILPSEVTFDGVMRKFTAVGTILSLRAQAEGLKQEVGDEISAALEVAEQATSEPRAAYLYVRGPETLLLFGSAMPTHFLIEGAGGIDAAGEADVVFAENLSAERLVEAAPEVLITPEEGFEIIGGLDSFLALPGVADTPAGRSRNILTYDEALLLGMGPRVGQALMQLVLDLHPELDGA
ncbi:MAG: heme/hemin ABC transporter substrate-binding protein [Acidimicrobiia bacterium]